MRSTAAWSSADSVERIWVRIRVGPGPEPKLKGSLCEPKRRWAGVQWYEKESKRKCQIHTKVSEERNEMKSVNSKSKSNRAKSSRKQLIRVQFFTSITRLLFANLDQNATWILLLESVKNFRLAWNQQNKSTTPHSRKRIPSDQMKPYRRPCHRSWWTVSQKHQSLAVLRFRDQQSACHVPHDPWSG